MWHFLTAQGRLQFLNIVQIRVSHVVRASVRSVTTTQTAALVGKTKAENSPENISEGILEVPVGHDVDKGVQGRVEVADPEENGDHHIRARTVGIPANGHRQVPGEKG